MNNLSLKKLVLYLAEKLMIPLAGAAMAFCMAVCIPVTANAEEFIVGYDENILLSDSTSTIYTVEYDGTYCQTDCRKMLELVNEFRTGDDAWYWNSDNTTKTECTGLSELTYDYALEKVAMQRAAECAIYYSHTRPDSGTCFEAYYDYNYSAGYKGENIAAGYTSYSAVFTGWEEADEDYSGQGHRRNMLSSNFNRIGIAGIKYNGVWYWAMELASSSSTITATQAVDTLTTVSADIVDSFITARSLTASNSSIDVNLNEGVDIPSVTAQITMTETWNYYTKLCTVRPEYSYSIADTSVASISNGKIYGMKAGTTTLTISALGTSTAVTINVYGSENANILVTFDGNSPISGTTVSNVPSVQTVRKNISFTLSTTQPELTGYTFKGWATSSSATSAAYQPGDTCTFSAGTTLYAVWEKSQSSGSTDTGDTGSGTGNTEETESKCTFNGVKLWIYKDGNIGMDFLFDIDYTPSTDKVRYYCYVDGTWVSPELSWGYSSSEGKYTSIDMIVTLTPEQLASVVKIGAGVGDSGTVTISATVSTSINEYINAVMNGTDASDDDRALLVSLLNYGSSIQEYFESEYSPSNSSLTQAQRELYAPTNLDSYASVLSGTCPGLEYLGSSLLIGSDTVNDTSITVRHYFRLTGDKAITDYTIKKWNNNTSCYNISSSYGQSGDLYYFDITGSTPDLFGTVRKITVVPTSTSSASTETFTLSYSVMSYVNDAYDKYLAENPSAASSTTLGIAGVAGSGADSLTKLVVALSKYYEMIMAQ